MKSVEEHLLEGTYRPDRQGRLEDYEKIKTEISSVDCPKTIKDKRTKQAWNQVVGILCKSGRVCEDDIPLLEVAFMALEEVYVMKDKLDKYLKATPEENLSINTINKYAMIISRGTNDYKNIMTLFGITPLQKMRFVSGISDLKKNSLADTMLKKNRK